MKKKNIKNLELNKKSIINFYNSVNGGAEPTCEGPCVDGTGCCIPGPGPKKDKTGTTGMFSGCIHVC